MGLDIEDVRELPEDWKGPTEDLIGLESSRSKQISFPNSEPQEIPPRCVKQKYGVRGSRVLGPCQRFQVMTILAVSVGLGFVFDNPY